MNKFVALLEKEMIPALGCTDPVAFGLAAAVARRHAPGKLKRIHMEGSALCIGGIQGVGVPHSNGQRGAKLCAAMGYTGGDPALDMEVLKAVTPEKLKEAEEIVASGIVSMEIVKIQDCPATTWLKTTVETDEHTATVAIASSHNNIVYIEEDGKVLLDKIEETRANETIADLDMSWLTLDSIYDFCSTCDRSELGIIQQSIDLTRAICKDGMEHPYGMNVARTLQANIDKGLIAADEINYILKWAVAGVDARMGGSNCTAMASACSGNQGIELTMAPLAAGEFWGDDEDKIFRAVTMSNLVNLYLKYSTKEFRIYPPQCYCASMAPAAAVSGVAYLHGLSKKQINDLVRTSINNMVGIGCDGAKPGCAFKVFTGLSAALQAMLMAESGNHCFNYEGLADDDIDVMLDKIYRFIKKCMINMADEQAQINLEHGSFV